MEKAGAVLSKVTEALQQANEEIAALKAKNEDFGLKIEKLQKARATTVPGFAIPSGDEYSEMAPRYGLLKARRDVAMGKSQNVPMWDEETQESFGDFARMVKAKDNDGIRKAFGDNVYTETTSAGGYAIPTPFRPEIVRLTYLRSLMLGLCTIWPMPSNTLKGMIVSSGYTAGWGTINTQISDAKATLGQVSLSAEKLVSLSIVPNELLGDAGVPIADMIANEWAEAFALKIDEEVMQGDTSDTTNHKFNGWAFASNVEDVSGDTGDSAAGWFTTANILAIPGKLEDRELVGAQWFMHPTVWAVVRALSDTSSDLLVAIDKSYSYDLLGFPVNRSSQATAAYASIAADGATMLFGNPKHIIIGDRMALEVGMSEHVRFDYDQTVYRAVQRLALQVALPSSIAMGTRGPAAG